MEALLSFILTHNSLSITSSIRQLKLKKDLLLNLAGIAVNAAAFKRQQRIALYKCL